MRRRDFNLGCVSLAAGALTGGLLPAQEAQLGVISGEPTAEKAAKDVFVAGGNAIDAVVAAAFVAAIVVPHQTGLGGYGGHATLAVDADRDDPNANNQRSGLAAKKKIVCIDFNSIAPAAARGEMFALSPDGKVIGQKNMFGWLAAGVPGILAGLELAQKRYGTKPLREVMQAAIALAHEGFPFGSAGGTMAGAARQLAADPASQKLYFRDGVPLKARDHYANPDAARMLEQFARDNSVESFYRGEIAERIARAFAAGGGLVTQADLAAYQAREVAPTAHSWGDWTIHTAPLTAGGVTTIEAIALLQELKWADRDPMQADTLALELEAFRYAWQDRLELFGDPDHVAVPLDRFRDPAKTRSVVAAIEQAVANKRPLPVRVTSRPDQGTIHLSAADAWGNLAALTLTHGGAFGARVTVPGLGLTLGHGMSRFDARPGHPNAPGPHKRPLNNMCPTILSKDGVPMIAVGGRGGRKIPNAIAEVVLQLVARGKNLQEAVAAPRLHTEGTLSVSFERGRPASLTDELRNRGYAVSTAASATVSAAQGGQEPGALRTAMR